MAPSTLRHDNLKGLTPKIRGVHWLCCRQEQAALIDLSKANKPSAYIMAQLPQIQARHLVSCFDATSVDDCGTLPHSVTSCRLQRASASIYVLSGISDPFGFKSLDIGMIAAIPESVPGIGKLGLRKSPEEMDTHTHSIWIYIVFRRRVKLQLWECLERCLFDFQSTIWSHMRWKALDEKHFALPGSVPSALDSML